MATSLRSPTWKLATWNLELPRIVHGPTQNIFKYLKEPSLTPRGSKYELKKHKHGILACRNAEAPRPPDFSSNLHASRKESLRQTQSSAITSRTQGT
jgi:hypothetical protein